MLQRKASSMAFETLPTELLLHITAYINEEGDLNALICTHPRFHQIFNHTLYLQNVQSGAPTFFEQVAKGRDAAVKRFLEEIPDLATRCSRRGATYPLYHAAYNGHTSTAIILLDHGADVHQSSNCRWGLYDSPLQVAVRHNHLHLVNLLLSRGADVRMPYPTPYPSLHRDMRVTPLHVASLHASVHLVYLLLLHGADVFAKNETDEYPINWAKGGDLGRDDPQKGFSRKRTIRLLREAEVKYFRLNGLSVIRGEWDKDGARAAKMLAQMLLTKIFLGGSRLGKRQNRIWAIDYPKRGAEYWYFDPMAYAV